MHGIGKYIWPNGRIYEGNYVFDKKHGYGMYKWPDGRKYEGNWNDGKQDGKGKYYDADGNLHYGIWKNGKRLKWISQESFEKYVENTISTEEYNTNNMNKTEEGDDKGANLELGQDDIIRKKIDYE